MKTWWLIFCLSFLVATAWSFQAEPYFKAARDQFSPLYFSTAAITRYTDGRILVGSDRGLFLYDGYQFQPLAPEDNPGNIKVTFLLVDDSGFIWVGTTSGLYKVDSNFQWQPVPLSFQGEALNPYISTVYPVSQNEFIVVNVDGKMLRISEGGVPSRLERLSSEPRTIARKFLPDQSGRIWIQSTRGLWFTDTLSNSNETTYLPLKEFTQEGPAELHGRVLQTIFMDAEKKHLYILTYRNLYKLDTETAQITTIITRDAIDQKQRIKRFKDAVIYQGEFWIATYGGGLIRGKDQTWSQYALNTLHLSNEFDDFINGLYLDQQDNLWLAGDQKGLLYLNLPTLSIENFRSNRKKTGCLKHDEIYSIFKQKTGDLWLGTRGGGAYRINGGTGECKNYVRTEDELGVGSNQIYSIASQANGTLWFASEGHGITRLDPKSGLSRRFVRQDPTAGLRNNDVMALEPVSDGLWIGTLRGIAEYDISNDRFISYQYPNPQSLLDNRVFAIVHDKKEEAIWVGTEGGVQMFDLKKRQYQEKNPRLLALSAIKNRILALESFSPDTLYIGTENAGLFRLEGTSLTQVNQSQGLPGNKVASILQDSSGNIWVGTNKGVAKLDATSLQVLDVFLRQHGVRYGEVTQSGFYSPEEGMLYFAGTNGMVRIPESFPSLAGLNHQPILERMRLFNQPLDLVKHKSYTQGTRFNEAKQLTLTHHDNLVDFEFVAPSYLAPNLTQYRFRLYPFQEKWIETNSQARRATYTQLPPGQYQFEVDASERNGRWSEKVKRMSVTVLPPWWATWWARTLYVLLLIGSVIAIFIYRTRAIRQRARELSEMVKSRTAQLNQEKERVENLLEHKNEEFANVSHEFRTPLTLVLGQAKKLIAQESDKVKQKALAAIQRNGSLILRMVDQLISLEKYRVHRYRTQVIDVRERIEEYAYSFTDLCHEKGLDFTLLANEPAWVDSTPEAFEKMLLNLLSNAVKYTPKGGKVSLSSSINTDGLCEISVSDTGIGIPESMLEKVFERFQRVSEYSEVAGAGIGLSLVKELAESHGGQVSVKSEEGKGSTFTLQLPATEEPNETEESTAVITSNINAELALDSHDVPEPRTEEVDWLASTPQNDDICILIVEDNLELQDYLLEFLSPRYRCVAANDGEAGYKKADELLPDLVISDIMMPKMSGFEMLSKLKAEEKTSHIPLILLTAKGDKASRIKGWKNLADEYLTKPFDPDELLIRVENLLSIRDLLKQRYGEVLKSQGDNAIEQLKNELPAQDIEFLEKLQTLVEENLADSDFSTAKLAKALFMSDRQVQRKVKAISGFSPNEYLRIQRLNRGAKLLASDSPIKVIAFDVGFTSVQYFSSCFKAQFGQSPNEYRNQLPNAVH